MSSMDESVLYRLKNLNDHNVISVYKVQFKIGRATSKLHGFCLHIFKLYRFTDDN